MSFRLDANLIELFMRESQTKVDDPIKIVIQSAIAASCTIYVKSGKSEWTGSGFHLGKGLIATASHVAPPKFVNDYTGVQVTFDGKTPLQARVVNSQPNLDVAILYCEEAANSIPSVQLANSDNAEVGDIIAAIGSPEGWHDTATVGRISNIHQSVLNADSEAWSDIIFIDADILQGISGGMVIGTDGLVYGLVIGVTGEHADIAIGENSVCPSNKIKMLLDEIDV
jgi:S1-C subfamily serine protease